MQCVEEGGMRGEGVSGVPGLHPRYTLAWSDPDGGANPRDGTDSSLSTRAVGQNGLNYRYSNPYVAWAAIWGGDATGVKERTQCFII